MDGEEGKPGAERASRGVVGRNGGERKGAVPGTSRVPPLSRAGGYFVVLVGEGSGEAAMDCGDTVLA